MGISGVLWPGYSSCPKLLKLISAPPKGKAFKLTYIDHRGRRRELKGTLSIEREARIEVPSQARVRSYLNFEMSVPTEYRTGLEYRDTQDLTAQLLKWQPSGDFRFMSLGQDETIVHGEWIYDKKFINPEYRNAPFVMSINGGALWSDDGIEMSNLVDFHVNAQSEVGQYFDSDDGVLSKQGIALRVKSWHRFHETENEIAAAPRSMTLKRELGNARGFHMREEWNIRLPLSTHANDIEKIAFALMTKVKVKPPVELLAKDRIHNQRLGVNWYYKKSKIGFALIDLFADINNPEQRHAQIELELVDGKVTRELLKSPREIKKFLLELRNFVSGTEYSRIPKRLAVKMRPSTQPEIRIPEGPIESFSLAQSEAYANGFALFYLNDQNEIAKLHLDLKTFMMSTYEPMALTKVADGVLYIRQTAVSPWVPVAEATDERAQFMEPHRKTFVEGVKYEVLPSKTLFISHQDEANSLEVNWE